MDVQTFLKFVGIGGLALVLFFGILRQILAKTFYPKLSQPQAFGIVMRILTLAAILAGLALIAWAFLQWRQQPKTENIELDDEPTKHVQISYYRFNGLVLLDRAMREQGFTVEDGFSATPTWVKNDIFKVTSDILSLYNDANRSAGPFARQEFDVMNWRAWRADGKEVEAVDVRDRKIEKETFDRSRRKRGYSAELSAAVPNRHPYFFQIDPISMFQKVESSATWFVGIGPSLPVQEISAEPIGYSHYYFFGLPPSAELVNRPIDPISRQALAANPGLNDVVFLYGYQVHGEYAADVLIREIKLLVLDIENRGNKPIGLQSLHEKELSTKNHFELRTKKAVDLVLSNGQWLEQKISVDVLKPGEHLFVPLQIQLGIADTHSERLFNYERYAEAARFPTRWWEDSGQQQFAFEVLRSVDQMGNPNQTEIYRVPRAEFEKKPDLTKLIEHDYTMGSVLDVKEVIFRTADGKPQPLKVRRFDPMNLLVRGAYEKGSCPILFTRSSSDKDFRRIGPILVDAVASSAERTEVVKLGAFVDSVEVVELEDETTFLKGLHMVVKDEGGNETKIYPDHFYSNYVRLDRGTRKRFHFSLPNTLKDAPERELVVTGYYVPTKLIRASSTR